MTHKDWKEYLSIMLHHAGNGQKILLPPGEITSTLSKKDREVLINSFNAIAKVTQNNMGDK